MAQQKESKGFEPPAEFDSEVVSTLFLSEGFKVCGVLERCGVLISFLAIAPSVGVLISSFFARTERVS
jgi:hypothetical protein